MIKVWFNHWFSTSYNIIGMMKMDKDEEIFVIGTNRRIHSVISQVCDEWYEEPDLEGEEYIEFCIDFCRKHDVDAFVPRSKMADISRNITRFQEIGVKVMADSYEKINILNNKAKTYELFQKEIDIKVPEFEAVTTLEDFNKAYDKLSSKYHKLCVKFVNDEGGMSFRIIEQDGNQYRSLFQYPGSLISIRHLKTALSERENFKELMVMPFLSGEEISVDCLNTESGLIAVPRYKGGSRAERIEYDSCIIHMCRRIMEIVHLEFPCNIQFKLLDDIPYLLEINTRMSGGIQMSCLGAEINIPNIALNKVLGKNIDWTLNKHECIVSYIEIPQIITIK